MKRAIALILAFLLTLSLSACVPIVGTPDHTTGQSATTQMETTTVDTTCGEKEETTDSTTETEIQPSQGMIIDTKPGNSQSQSCKHDYRLVASKESTCTKAGTKTYGCTKCCSEYTEAQALLPHNYAEATCQTPKKCKICSAVSGQVLPHAWNKYDYCTVCGVKNTQTTGPVDFKITVKSDENKLLSGVTVKVYTTTDNQPAGTGVTDSKGVATITIERHTGYKVILADVPKDYTVKESYSFTGTTVTINLKTEPIYDPLDHSKARYKEGDTMVDFTLKDIDGNTLQLSQLLQKKKLIILDFWYVNCGPCKSEFPYFDKAVEKYGDKIQLLALNPIDSEDSIRQLRDDMGVNFTMLREELGIAAGFGVTAYPTTVFIDSAGKIRTIHIGAYASEEAFLRAIERYLQNKKSPAIAGDFCVYFARIASTTPFRSS